MQPPQQNAVQPQQPQPDTNAAADLIRQKLAVLYAEEPNAQTEAAAIADVQPRYISKHQQYLQDLQSSGKSWAEIQNAWHAYYAGLPDTEKHEVWQEFYATSNNSHAFQPQAYAAQPQPIESIQTQPVEQPKVIAADFTPIGPSQPAVSRPTDTISDIKQRIRNTVSAGGKLGATDHLKSLMFGMASGAVVVFIFLFGFFNEFFITPFIQPNRQASETPVIVDPASAVVGEGTKVIIPKINVEIPTDFSLTSNDNKTIEEALDRGVVHYPTTVRPGQAGNAAFFGHSSNNIFNPGKYKFAFVMLHKLVEGDTFYLTYEGKAYAYEVISRRVVEPTEVGVLGPVPGQTATATLITCDPPGTSLKRLVVVGKQISPDPAGNAAPADQNVPVQTAFADDLPGNGPTLWSRFWGSVF